MGLPHSEDTLALLVNVRIAGRNKDLAEHLKGLTMRVRVIQDLIDILRCTGYPGYDKHGVNAPDKVATRLHERYTSKYGTAQFTPGAVMDAVHLLDKQKSSITQDKVATPSDAPQSIQEWDRSLRPHHIVAERSVNSQANIHENYKAVFAQFGVFNIQTGTHNMENQHLPWYLGMSFLFTLPSAVGGYDVPFQPRWWRPEDGDLPWPRAQLPTWLTPVVQIDNSAQHEAVGPARTVKLFDITRGLPQRIEGQYRRHWSFTPALWNLYFREPINMGVGLSVKRSADVASENCETDAAMAAADLLQKLENGTYMHNGKRLMINGDYINLLFVEN